MMIRLMLLVIAATCCLSATAQDQRFTVMTYNIRYDNPNDGQNNWHHRKDDMVAFIEEVDPLVFGIQEGLHQQVLFLDQALGRYQYTGVGRDDGKTKGEYCAIFYQPQLLNLKQSGTFWLSETPDTLSTGWDAALPRICSYGLFKMKNKGLEFWVFNTHFDHIGEIAREKSSALITERIRTVNSEGLPVVLMGDFNATPDEEPIKIIQKDLVDSKAKFHDAYQGPNGTFNGFDRVVAHRRIDYIFSSGFSVDSFQQIDAKTSKGRYLSDHLPVIVGFMADGP